MKKILAVCQHGSCRSVAMARFVKEWVGIDGLAASYQYNRPETMRMLCEWADRIVVMMPEYASFVPAEFASKVRICDVGQDNYGSPFNPELLEKCRAFYNRGGFN